MSVDLRAIDECRSELETLLQKDGIDEFERRAISYISYRLSQFSRGDAARSEKHRGELARIVIETNPNVLPPALGGRVIDIEKAFYSNNL